jgi:hypothetical protein
MKLIYAILVLLCTLVLVNADIVTVPYQGVTGSSMCSGTVSVAGSSVSFSVTDLDSSAPFDVRIRDSSTNTLLETRSSSYTGSILDSTRCYQLKYVCVDEFNNNPTGDEYELTQTSSSFYGNACSATHVCGALPANAQWAGFSSYGYACTQANSAGTCLATSPSISAPHLQTDPSDVYCSFVCSNGFTWNGGACVAVANPSVTVRLLDTSGTPLPTVAGQYRITAGQQFDIESQVSAGSGTINQIQTTLVTQHKGGAILSGGANAYFLFINNKYLNITNPAVASTTQTHRFTANGYSSWNITVLATNQYAQQVSQTVELRIYEPSSVESFFSPQVSLQTQIPLRLSGFDPSWYKLVSRSDLTSSYCSDAGYTAGTTPFPDQNWCYQFYYQGWTGSSPSSPNVFCGGHAQRSESLFSLANPCGEPAFVNEPYANATLVGSAWSKSGSALSASVVSGPAQIVGGVLSFSGLGPVQVRLSHGEHISDSGLFGAKRYWLASSQDVTLTVNESVSMQVNSTSIIIPTGQLLFSWYVNTGSMFVLADNATAYPYVPNTPQQLGILYRCVGGECGSWDHLTLLDSIRYSDNNYNPPHYNQSSGNLSLSTLGIGPCQFMVSQIPTDNSSFACAFSYNFIYDASLDNSFSFKIIPQQIPLGAPDNPLNFPTNSLLNSLSSADPQIIATNKPQFNIPVLCAPYTKSVYYDIQCDPTSYSCNADCSYNLTANYTLDFDVDRHQATSGSYLSINASVFSQTVYGYAAPSLSLTTPLTERILKDGLFIPSATQLTLGSTIVPAQYNVTVILGTANQSQSTNGQAITAGELGTLTIATGAYSTSQTYNPAPANGYASLTIPQVAISTRYQNRHLPGIYPSTTTFTFSSNISVIAILLRCQPVNGTPSEIPYFDNDCNGHPDVIDRVGLSQTIDKFLPNVREMGIVFAQSGVADTAEFAVLYDPLKKTIMAGVANDIIEQANQNTQTTSCQGTIQNTYRTFDSCIDTSPYDKSRHTSQLFRLNITQARVSQTTNTLLDTPTVTAPHYTIPSVQQVLNKTFSTGLLFKTPAGVVQALSLETNTSDVCFGRDGCCYQGTLYPNGAEIEHNIFTNAPLAQPIKTHVCRSSSPGGWELIGFATNITNSSVCDDTFHRTCLEQSSIYNSSQDYTDDLTNAANYFCVKPNTSASWGFYRFPSGGPGLALAQIQANAVEDCTDIYDNVCFADTQFARYPASLGITDVDYSSWNSSVYAPRVVYDVNPFDISLFQQQCRSNLTLQTIDTSGLLVSNVSLELYIIAPNATPQAYVTNYTDNAGQIQYNFQPSVNMTIIARKVGYNPTLLNIRPSAKSSVTLNITMTTGGCRPDCTTDATPQLCSAMCHGINGCAFNTSMFATELDGKLANQFIQVSGGQSVYSCEGQPFAYTNTSTGQITCPAGQNVIIVDRLVNLDGKPVRMKLAICK